MAGTWRDQINFLFRFLVRPKTLGAVAPSSPDLVAALMDNMGVPEARSLAELGPGTGVATEAIRAAKKPETPFVVVEKDEHWVGFLAERYPDLDLIHGDASELKTYVDAREMPPLDAVICGLPFTNFGDELQRAILTAVVASLKPGGAFSTFAYVHSKGLPAGRRFRSLLDEFFVRVETTDTVWRNTPPAVVYRAWTAE